MRDASDTDPTLERIELLNLHTQLYNERSSWIEHWREISEFIYPRRFRYLQTDRNRGTKKNEKLINNTAYIANRTLASGMHAGITSPARPWFHLTTPDPGLAERASVRSYLYTCEERMRVVFHRSNIYQALPLVYGDLGGFGTSALYVQEDDEDVIRAFVWPIGQYCLANSHRLAVDTVTREFSMTARQMAQFFGLEKCSEAVKNACKDQSPQGGGEHANAEAWFDVIHVIEPNDKFQDGYLDKRGMRFSSKWLEKSGDTTVGLLRDEGFHEMPGMFPRWEVTGEDAYGYSCGMHALGDARALQLYERRAAQAADKLVNPPMKAPMSLRNQRASLLPGDITYVDTIQGGQNFTPAVEINPTSLNYFDNTIARLQRRIDSTFFADLWLMMQRDDRTQPATAREITERHEEKMLQLGPVLERLHDELLDPLIDRTFNIMNRKGLLPKPPRELQGVELRVEYVSIMAQAQKILATSGIERLASYVGSLASVQPDVTDKFDFDRSIDDYANALGTRPDLVRTEDDVKAIRAGRQKKADQNQQLMAATEAAKGAKTLSETNLEGDTALTRMLGAAGGGSVVPPPNQAGIPAPMPPMPGAPA